MNEKIFDDEIVQNKINEIIKKFPNDQLNHLSLKAYYFFKKKTVDMCLNLS